MSQHYYSGAEKQSDFHNGGPPRERDLDKGKKVDGRRGERAEAQKTGDRRIKVTLRGWTGTGTHRQGQPSFRRQSP